MTNESSKSKVAAIYISSIICLVSLLFMLIVSYPRQVLTIPLKTGLFDDSNNKYDFTFQDLQADKYKIILKLHKKENIDYTDVINNKFKYDIAIELSDIENNLLEKKIINQDSRIESAWANDYIELTILSFKGEPEQKYSLSVSSQSDDNYFNKFMTKNNELYIQEDYDHAGMPGLYLFYFVFMAIFIITLLYILILLFRLYRYKKKQMIP